MNSPEIAFAASNVEESVKIVWYVDSGATNRMVNNSRYFVSIQQFVPPVEIVVTNGQKLLEDHSGTVVMYAVIDGKRNKWVAKDVLYLPGLTSNILLVKRVTRSGFEVRFTKDMVESTRNGAVRTVGWLKGKL